MPSECGRLSLQNCIAGAKVDKNKAEAGQKVAP